MEKPAARIGSRELTQRQLTRLLLDEACVCEGITVSDEEVEARIVDRERIAAAVERGAVLPRAVLRVKRGENPDIVFRDVGIPREFFDAAVEGWSEELAERMLAANTVEARLAQLWEQTRDALRHDKLVQRVGDARSYFARLARQLGVTAIT